MIERIVVHIDFSGEIFHWRGPAPFHFVRVPDDQAAEIKAVSSMVSYGWGMIPVRATIGGTSWKTALFPKNGSYLLPLRDFVRTNEQLELGEFVQARLDI